MRLNNIPGLSKKVVLVFGFMFTVALIRQFFYFSYSFPENEKTSLDFSNSHLKTFGLNGVGELSFAGENVPLNDFTVAKNFDRELLENASEVSQSIPLFKRASFWFPVIEPILKKNGIPSDFKYIAVVESRLTNNLVSPAKAAGYWQLAEETARTYGLQMNDEVDERYSMEKSTEAACRYFGEAHQRFHNWTLVAAAYNMGISGLESQLNIQKTNNYYDLFLNEETARYVFRILAVKELFSNPSRYADGK